MVLYNRINIPDAFIIDEAREKEKLGHDFDGIGVADSPTFEVHSEPDKLADTTEEVQSRVIIIDF